MSNGHVVQTHKLYDLAFYDFIVEVKEKNDFISSNKLISLDISWFMFYSI